MNNFYEKYSPKQLLSYRDSNAKINIWEGAVRSGKTCISLLRFVKELIHSQNNEFAMVTRTYDSFKRNILPILTTMLNTEAKWYAGKRELNIFGKTIHVIGANDERAETKIKGATFAGAYVDEATLIPESFFKMLISRCAMHGARIFTTTNPDSSYHWFKKDYLEGNPDVAHWQFNMDDNPALTQADKEYFARQYKGIWYKRYIEGLWVQAEGAIYDFFDVDTHTIDFPRSLASEYILGVDYGTTNACSYVLIGCNPNKPIRLWVEDEYYWDSRLQQRQKTDSEYADDLKRFIKDKYIKAIYIDPSAASFKAELHKQGVSNVFPAENEVLDGIRLVSDMLANGTIKICKKAANLIKEIQSYVWDNRSIKIGEDKPLKQNDHACDALRYALYSHRQYFGKEQINWESVKQEVFGQQPNIPKFFSDPIDMRYSF